MSLRVSSYIGLPSYLALLSICVCAAFTRTASAEDKPSARARVLFEEGRRLAKQEKFAEACPKLAASYGLDRGVGTEFNLADCWEHLGKLELARTLFLDVAQKTREAGQPERAQVAMARALALASAQATPVAAPAPPPAVTAASTREVQNVPELVVVAPESKPASALVAPSPVPEEESSLPPKLREEYGVLAEAASQLHALRESVARLGRSPEGAARARELTSELARAERELQASFKLAGQVAAQAIRQVAWARHGKKPPLQPAQPAPPVPASELASTAAERR